MHAIIKPLLLTAFVAMLGACDSVPKEEFKAYSEAFVHVSDASERMLSEYSLAKEERGNGDEAAPEADDSNPYPSPSALKRLIVQEAPDNDIAQRRRAIEVVTRYNDLMLVLAEGKSPAEVKSSAESLITAINGVGALFNVALPGIPGPAIDIATKFIAAIQAADNRAQFADALRLGEPLIQGILTMLKMDALDLYDIRWALAEKKTDRHVLEILTMERQITGVLAEFRKPPDNSADFKRFNERLEASLASVGLTKPEDWPNDPAKPEFSAFALSQIEQTEKLIAAEAAKVTALQAEMKAYSDVTVTYVGLIQQTMASLSQVRTALDKPADIKAQALQIIKFAFEVKRDFEALNAKKVPAG